VQTAVCSGGTCALSAPADAGSVACGSTTCTAGQVCVMDQFEGGVLVMPNDAGMCPAGDQNQNGQCQPLPTYHCATFPAAGGSSLACGAARSVGDGGSPCQSATAGLVQCFLMAP